jgi:uncharacterized membrane protein (UPF0127 family)
MAARTARPRTNSGHPLELTDIAPLIGAMRRFGPLFSAILSLWLVGAGPGPAYAAGRQPLEIATAAGTRTFSVELAKTRPELDRGLMYRRSLPSGQGMLFDFGAVRPITMWMKNTYVPLDMIFIGPDGRVRRIAANTKPQSTRLIPGGEGVRYVLEVSAGSARKLGIAIGDRVSHPAIAPQAK